MALPKQKGSWGPGRSLNDIGAAPPPAGADWWRDWRGKVAIGPGECQFPRLAVEGRDLGGQWMGAGGGGGRERSPERWKKVGSAGAGAWPWQGGRVLERKVKIGPQVSSCHRPNCHSRPSAEGAGPSLPPPGIPRELLILRGSSQLLIVPRQSQLRRKVSPSDIPHLKTPPRPAPQPWGRTHRFPSSRVGPPPHFVARGGQTSLPTPAPAR